MTRVGFNYEALAGWTGGVNYLRSLVSAIMLDAGRSIEPVVFAAPEDAVRLRAEIPGLEVVATPWVRRGSAGWYARKLWQRMVRRDWLLERLLVRQRIALLSHSGSLGSGSRVPALAWVVDLQHRRLPAFFTPAELRGRDATFERWRHECAGLLFSSQSARRDFAEYFGTGPECHVVPFVPDTRPQAVPVVDESIARHGLPVRYFHVPNQFWPHKNHALVIEAVRMLKARGVDVCVVFTGAPGPGADPSHHEGLKAAAAPLGNSVRFLGFLPYAEVTALMQGTIAVINPSRFEGWSTTVEEARNLGKCTLLSDIDAHREQAPPGAAYFGVDDAEELARHMEAVLNRNDVPRVSPFDAAGLRARRLGFARAFQATVEAVLVARGDVRKQGRSA